MSQLLRLAAQGDSEAILAIYAPYITDTTITFEYEVPSADAFARRIEGIAADYPYLVCEVGGEIAGYAYASKHRERTAYLYDVDAAIYLHPDYHGSGAARRLYGCLFWILAELGYYNVYAAYVDPNEKSMRFHEKMGFRPVGTFRNTGYKHGKWLDVTWAEKILADRPAQPEPTRSIRELPEEFLREALLSFSSEEP